MLSFLIVRLMALVHIIEHSNCREFPKLQALSVSTIMRYLPFTP